MDTNYLLYGALFIAVILVFVNFKKVRANKIPPIKMEQIREYHSFLVKNFLYYRKLSAADRRKFIERVHRFIYIKTFTGKDGFELNQAVKTLISASAIQLTFGLEKYDLGKFKTFFIYPETFQANPHKFYIKGGVTPAGQIGFSWPDFMKGYMIVDDNYNLGLHEMAHALKLDALEGKNPDPEFKRKLDLWLNKDQAEFEKLQNGHKSILRGYGGENMTEYFAVIVEQFFESPLQFHQNLPEVYQDFANMLNQDPIRF